MRINIEHSEMTTGVFKKTTHYCVDVTVQFSEEEHQIIKERNLRDYVVLERDMNTLLDYVEGRAANYNHLCIKDLVRGKPASHCFATIVEAKNYDAQLKEILPELKAFIEANTEIEEKSSTFEL